MITLWITSIRVNDLQCLRYGLQKVGGKLTMRIINLQGGRHIIHYDELAPPEYVFKDPRCPEIELKWVWGEFSKFSLIHQHFDERITFTLDQFESTIDLYLELSQLITKASTKIRIESALTEIERVETEMERLEHD